MNQKQQDLLAILGECALACEQCFDGCLHEKDLHMLANCIRLNAECALVCRTTSALIGFNSDYAGQLIDMCSDICAGCARESEQHKHDHCRYCAEVCRKCEEACENYAPSTS